ncbi:MAG: YHS domain-containing protein [Chloroflexi bacterium]|nr:YHS domain-containing protein [Chloroflexota bacterium]
MTIHDPVCGMEINPKSAFATRQHMGRTFYLCSQSCAEKFDADPHRYASVVSSATTGIASDASGPVRIALPVGGLKKSGGPALEGALRALSGVSKVTANTKEGRVFVEYDPARVTVTDLLDAVRSAGFIADGQSMRLLAI